MPGPSRVYTQLGCRVTWGHRPSGAAHNELHFTFWQFDTVVKAIQALRRAKPDLSASIQEVLEEPCNVPQYV
jgi:hypothetical protein